MFKADSIVRVCCDNPLIAPEEIDRLIEFFEKILRTENNIDDQSLILHLYLYLTHGIIY